MGVVEVNTSFPGCTTPTNTTNIYTRGEHQKRDNRYVLDGLKPILYNAYRHPPNGASVARQLPNCLLIPRNVGCSGLNLDTPFLLPVIFRRCCHYFKNKINETAKSLNTKGSLVIASTPSAGNDCVGYGLHGLYPSLPNHIGDNYRDDTTKGPDTSKNSLDGKRGGNPSLTIYEDNGCPEVVKDSCQFKLESYAFSEFVLRDVQLRFRGVGGRHESS